MVGLITFYLPGWRGAGQVIHLPGQGGDGVGYLLPTWLGGGGVEGRGLGGMPGHSPSGREGGEAWMG